MSTITLEEALKGATKGPLRCNYTSAKKSRMGSNDGTDGGGGDGSIQSGSSWRNGKIIAWLPHHRDEKEDSERECNAALLTHCFNLFPEMVEALRSVVGMSKRPLGPHDYPSSDKKPNQHGGRWAYRHEEMGAVVKGILAKAETVTIPES